MSNEVWVRDRQWVKLEKPMRCRRKSGNPSQRCEHMTEYGINRINGVWAYCLEHFVHRRLKNGVIEVMVHSGSDAAERGYL